MTPSERKLFNAVNRRAAEMTPELARAFLLAFAAMRERMTEQALIRAIQLGTVERIFADVLTEAVRLAAYQVIRDRMRVAIEQGVRYYGKTLPPKITGELSIRMDWLNPRMVDAVRTLETRVITTLDESIRATVKQAVERGFVEGLNPRTIAKGLRDVIGLAPSQEQQVANFRKALETAHEGSKAFDYAARDKRFDATLKKARASGEPIPQARIDRMVEAYRKRRIALNAETTARTAAHESQLLAQKLSWQDAIDRGAVDPNSLWRRWVTTLDGRERPEHHDMHNAEARYDEPYRNGDHYAGEGDPWNCRCAETFFIRAA